jgi:hypothetical protein
MLPKESYYALRAVDIFSPRSLVSPRPRQERIGDEIAQQWSGCLLLTISSFIDLISDRIFGAFGLRLNAGFWNRTSITLTVDPEVEAPFASPLVN